MTGSLSKSLSNVEDSSARVPETQLSYAGQHSVQLSGRGNRLDKMLPKETSFFNGKLLRP